MKPKHEIFAAGLASGLSQRQAAIAAGYPASSADKAGYRLAKNVAIAERVAVLQKPSVMLLPSREELIARIRTLGVGAERVGQYAAAMKAEEMLAKMAGYFNERNDARDIVREALTLSAVDQFQLLRAALVRLQSEAGLTIDAVPTLTSQARPNPKG